MQNELPNELEVVSDEIEIEQVSDLIAFFMNGVGGTAYNVCSNEVSTISPFAAAVLPEMTPVVGLSERRSFGQR